MRLLDERPTAANTIKLPVLLAIEEGAQRMHLEMTETKEEPRFKGAILSSSDAIRTTFLSRIADDCSTSFSTARDIDIKSVSIDTPAGPIKFQIFNSVDQGRFGSIAHSFYSVSDCVFIMPDSSESLTSLLEKIQKDFRKHNLYTVLYDGREILLLDYSADNLFHALHHNHTPSDLRSAGRRLLTQAANYFDLGIALKTEPAASATATSSEERSPRRGFFGFFSTPPKVASTASESSPTTTHLMSGYRA